MSQWRRIEKETGGFKLARYCKVFETSDDEVEDSCVDPRVKVRVGEM